MFKSLILPLIAVAAFIILVGVFTQKPELLGLNKYLPSANTNIITQTPQGKMVTIDNKVIQVEIASTAAARQKGLGGRTSLEANSGMLFVFDTKKVNPIFWMKDMLIPLDMIWIADGRIVKIDKNIPAPAVGTKDDDLIKISVSQSVDYVLEVNAGFSDSNNFKVGDSVDLSKI